MKNSVSFGFSRNHRESAQLKLVRKKKTDSNMLLKNVPSNWFLIISWQKIGKSFFVSEDNNLLPKLF